MVASARENLTFLLRKPEIKSFGTPLVEKATYVQPASSSHWSDHKEGPDYTNQDELIRWCDKNGYNPGATVVKADLLAYQHHGQSQYWGTILRHHRFAVIHPRKVLMVSWHGNSIEAPYSPEELILVCPAPSMHITQTRIEELLREWRGKNGTA